MMYGIIRRTCLSMNTSSKIRWRQAPVCSSQMSDLPVESSAQLIRTLPWLMLDHRSHAIHMVYSIRVDSNLDSIGDAFHQMRARSTEIQQTDGFGGVFMHMWVGCRFCFPGILAAEQGFLSVTGSKPQAVAPNHLLHSPSV
jgi:hypothetical protein